MASSVFRTGLFNNKVAIVTGGGTGIGKAITAELLQLGKHSGDVIHGFEFNLRTTDGMENPQDCKLILVNFVLDR